MITTENSPSAYKTPKVGQGADGVVRVNLDGSFGTGSLLYSGYHILTAAHLFKDQIEAGFYIDPDSVTIQFSTASGRTSVSVRQIVVHPDYNPNNSNSDLALITLSDPAPSSANRYNLYRDDKESSNVATLIGYGRQGTGQTGDDLDGDGLSRAQNHLEMSAGELEAARGEPLAWGPDADSILVADFDSGNIQNDTLSHLTESEQPDSGIYEGLIAPGDSGGPAFINGQLAGVASYTSSLSWPDTDNDNENNSSYGELGFWQRVSAYQEWIDHSIQEQYKTDHLVSALTGEPDKEKVTAAVTEGEDDWVFFLLQVTGSVTRDEPVTLDYSTRDGSATAGEDYIATTGSITLYAGDNRAWIPVEILNDSIAETDETFYLSVTNPQGISFADNQTELIAQRTIIDDDGWLI